MFKFEMIKHNILQYGKTYCNMYWKPKYCNILVNQ